MTEDKGFKKFEKLLAEFIPKCIEPHLEKMQEEGKSFINQTTTNFIIFNGYSEIKNTYDTLNLIEKFLSINPPDIEGIDYSNYLIYHIHNYLNEMYILKERLKSYATQISRKYKKDINVKSLIGLLIPLITNVLSCIVAEGKDGARNLHVHHERFMDEEMKWLSSTTFLSKHHKEFEIHAQKAYDIAQRKWINVIQNNNLELIKLFDIYFDTIYSIITINDVIVLPKDSR